MQILPNQIRAARGLIDWTVADLAKLVDVSPTTVSAIETGRSAGSTELLTNIYYAFQSAGIELTEDGGVRPIQGRISKFRGKLGLRCLYDDIFSVIKNHPNPDVCVTSNSDESYKKWLGDDFSLHHISRMEKIQPSKFKVLQKVQNNYAIGLNYCDYRWVGDDLFSNASFYIYGEKCAFIEFYENDVLATVVENKSVSDSIRKMFLVIWKAAMPFSV